MTPKDIKDIIQSSFDLANKESKSQIYKDKNALKSSKFVFCVGQQLYNFEGRNNLQLNVIKVDDSGKKHPGEWLLDIAITENKESFRKTIIWAVESESNTSQKAFDEDFSKLLHVKSKNYLYLNGLSQKTWQGKVSYINKRLEYAASILCESDINELYFGFFASPRKILSLDVSVWEMLELEYSHLREIELYQYKNSRFIKI